MIKKLKANIIKNFKLILRSKVSTLIILGGPLLLILLLGLGIKADASHTTIGHFTDSNANEEFWNLLQTMSQNTDFSFRAYDIKENCIDDVIKGRIQLCIEHNTKQDAGLHIYVDVAKSNLAYVILGTITGELEKKSRTIGTQTIRQILLQMIATSQKIQNSSKSLDEIQKEMNAVPIRMNEIKNGLGEFTFNISQFETNFDKDFKKAERKINNYEDDSDKEYKTLSQSILESRQEVQTNKQSLEERKQERDNNIAELNRLYETNNCANKKYSEFDINEKMPTFALDEDPLCSIIVSVRAQYEEETKDIDNSITMLENLDKKLEQAQKDLSKYKEDVDDNLEYADDKIRDAEKKYDDLKDKLEDMKIQISKLEDFKIQANTSLSDVETILKDSSKYLEEMKIILNNISQEFSSLKADDAGTIINPLATNVDMFNVAENKLEALFESILALIVGFTCILMASLIMVKEKNSPAFFRNSILKFPDSILISGTIITSIIIGIAQATIIILIGKYIFTLRGLDNLITIFIIIALGGTLFATIGIAIGTLMHNEENAVLTSIILTIILFMLSGIFIPKEFFTNLLFTLSNLNPFVLLESSLKLITVYNQKFISIQHLIYIIIETVVFFLIGYFTLKKQKKNL